MGLYSNEYAEEAATAKFLMKESFSRLDIAKYTANQNTVLVQSIQKSIPGTQLVPLGQSTTYYQSNGFTTKLDQVKALTHSKGTTVRLVDVPRTSLFSQLPERYREGIVRLMAEWQVAHKGGVTKSGVVEIVIFDKNAEGIVRKELLMPRLEYFKALGSSRDRSRPVPAGAMLFKRPMIFYFPDFNIATFHLQRIPQVLKRSNKNSHKAPECKHRIYHICSKL